MTFRENYSGFAQCGSRVPIWLHGAYAKGSHNGILQRFCFDEQAQSATTDARDRDHYDLESLWASVKNEAFLHTCTYTFRFLGAEELGIDLEIRQCNWDIK